MYISIIFLFKHSFRKKVIKSFVYIPLKCTTFEGKTSVKNLFHLHKTFSAMDTSFNMIGHSNSKRAKIRGKQRWKN